MPVSRAPTSGRRAVKDPRTVRVTRARIPRGPEHGTYALILRAASRRRIRIGKLGTLAVRPGSYVYVGSAYGPGGLRGRLRHHMRPAARPHWHIDYLRRCTRLDGVWLALDAPSREHAWAGVFERFPERMIPLLGFGSSGCSCRTHLFFFRMPPDLKRFRRCVRARVPGHARVEGIPIAAEAGWVLPACETSRRRDAPYSSRFQVRPRWRIRKTRSS
ncbi:MAG: DUF123 domain-containing protein [Acidobacteriota bacterium]